jgi:hypothetical protein
MSSSVKLEQCTVHKGVRRLKLEPYANVKVVKCTNCSGCQECRQPVPLKVPEGTGGSGCSAEVAAKAEALHAAAMSKASSSKPGTPESGSGGSMQQDLPTWLLWSVQSVTASQGTLVYLPPSSCAAGAA